MKAISGAVHMSNLTFPSRLWVGIYSEQIGMFQKFVIRGDAMTANVYTSNLTSSYKVFMSLADRMLIRKNL